MIFVKNFLQEAVPYIVAKIADIYIIKDFDKINWKDNFDTIIVGHVDVINKLMKLDFIQEIFEKCLKNKKNVYFAYYKCYWWKLP